MGTVQNYQKIAIELQADPQVHLLPKNVNINSIFKIKVLVSLLKLIIFNSFFFIPENYFPQSNHVN